MRPKDTGMSNAHISVIEVNTQWYKSVVLASSLIGCRRTTAFATHTICPANDGRAGSEQRTLRSRPIPMVARRARGHGLCGFRWCVVGPFVSGACASLIWFLMSAIGTPDVRSYRSGEKPSSPRWKAWPPTPGESYERRRCEIDFITLIGHGIRYALTILFGRLAVP